MGKNSKSRKHELDRKLLEKLFFFQELHRRADKYRKEVQNTSVDKPIFCIVGYNSGRLEMSGFSTTNGKQYEPDRWFVATQERIKIALGDISNKKKLTHELLEDNVLSVSENNGIDVIWYRPAKIEKLKIPVHYNEKQLYWIPPMIYRVSQENIYAAAFLERGRPTIKTELYNAPFGNWLSSHEACLGTASPDHSSLNTVADIIEQYERAFIKAKFTNEIEEPENYYPHVGPEKKIEEVFAFWQKNLEKENVTVKQWMSAVFSE